LKTTTILDNLSFDIVIPVKNDFKGLLKTLNSIESENAFTGEIIVVNDGIMSSEERIQLNQKAGLKVIDNRKQGAYSARNLGAQSTDADYIIFIDANLQITAGWFSTLAKFADDFPYIFGRVMIKQEPDESYLERMIRLRAFPFEHYFRYQNGACAGLLCVNRKVFESLNGFNEELDSYSDILLGRKFYETGQKQLYLREWIAYHGKKTWIEKQRNWKRDYRAMKEIKGVSALLSLILKRKVYLFQQLISLNDYRFFSSFESSRFTYKLTLLCYETLHIYSIFRALLF